MTHPRPVSDMEVPPPSLAHPITTMGSRMLWKSRFGQFHLDDVRFASGRAGTWWRVVHGDGLPPAVVMPVCGDHVALVRVWRHAVTAWEWGFPRGHTSSADPDETARQECFEETGTWPSELFRLGDIWPESAHNECTLAAYVARMPPEAMTGEPADSEEIAELAWVPVQVLARLIRERKISDGITLAVYGYWAAWTAENR